MQEVQGCLSFYAQLQEGHLSYYPFVDHYFDCLQDSTSIYYFEHLIVQVSHCSYRSLYNSLFRLIYVTYL